MRKITLTFITETGEKAYEQIEIEGKKQKFRDRKISESVTKDYVIGRNPLIVEVRIKIQWLAKKIELNEQIIDALKKYDAFIDVDYTILIE